MKLCLIWTTDLYHRNFEHPLFHPHKWFYLTKILYVSGYQIQALYSTKLSTRNMKLVSKKKNHQMLCQVKRILFSEAIFHQLAVLNQFIYYISSLLFRPKFSPKALQRSSNSVHSIANGRCMQMEDGCFEVVMHAQRTEMCPSPMATHIHPIYC